MAANFPFQQEHHQYDWRQHPQSAAAAQQHFNRLAALSNASTSAAPGLPVIAAGGDHQPSLLANQDPQVAEDNRRTLEWIAQLLIPASRETALLELSKKREQVHELALVLWHSFGAFWKLLRSR
jgi:CCR4-NOT transcription complex subunit 9